MHKRAQRQPPNLLFVCLLQSTYIITNMKHPQIETYCLVVPLSSSLRSTHAQMCMQHTCAHTCIPIYCIQRISVCMHACCVCVCVRACVHACMYVCTYVRMYVCTYVRMYVRTYVCIYANWKGATSEVIFTTEAL